MSRAAGPEGALAELARAIEVLVGQRPTADTRSRFAKYLALLTAWNRTHHLTAYRTPLDVVRGLFIDSLLFLPLLPPRPHRLLDIGSGPGIPAVPLRIVEPGISATLVESRRKPMSFVAALKRDLDLADIEVVHGRAGDASAASIGQYECVVTRGVRVDEELLQVARGYLIPGGRFIAASSPEGTGAPPGLRAIRVEKVAYPRLGLTRHFVLLDA